MRSESSTLTFTGHRIGAAATSSWNTTSSAAGIVSSGSRTIGTIAWAAAAFAWEHRDPCDRHILASAAALSLPLVTIDPKITAYASQVGVRIVW